METSLILRFERTSGKSYSLRLPHAKQVQDPQVVRQLMNHLVDQAIFLFPEDQIARVDSAFLETIEQEEILL